MKKTILLYFSTFLFSISFFVPNIANASFAKYCIGWEGTRAKKCQEYLKKEKESEKKNYGGSSLDVKRNFKPYEWKPGSKHTYKENGKYGTSFISLVKHKVKWKTCRRKRKKICKFKRKKYDKKCVRKHNKKQTRKCKKNFQNVCFEALKKACRRNCGSLRLVWKRFCQNEKVAKRDKTVKKALKRCVQDVVDKKCLRMFGRRSCQMKENCYSVKIPIKRVTCKKEKRKCKSFVGMFHCPSHKKVCTTKTTYKWKRFCSGCRFKKGCGKCK